MSELLRKAAETMKLLKKKPHLKPVAAGGGELSKAERWRTAQMAQDWLNANADPKYHRRRLPDMEENGQFKLLTRGRRGMERFFSAFSNWRNPGIRQLLKEYKIEGEMKGNAFWKSKRDFIDAVRNSKVEQITPEADAAISYRSRTPDKKSLLGLIKSYRSYPKFRNEGTLNAIYDGYKANAPMDRPIVVDFGKGKRRVFSGNTRMDAAFHSGVNPEVLVVPAQKNFSRHEFAMVKPVKVSKWADPETRKKFAKSLRRKLEKLASGKEEKLAIRSALGARPAKHQITTKSDAALATKLGHPTKPGYIHPQSAPQIVKVNGELSLLAFRGAKKGGTEPELKRILSRPRAGRFTTSPDHPTVAEARKQAGGFKGHVEQPQGAYLSLSTNKNMPKQEGWMGPNEQGESSLGVYATNIKKLLKRLANKEIGIVNSKFPQEHEITQKSGGNLISVRKFKGGTPGYHYPGEQRAFSRFHEFKSYDKTGEEERRDFLKAGIVGTGLAAAGGLAGLGLYKAGVSGAAQKLARLSRAVKKASANKAAGVRQAKVASAQAAAAATKQRDAAQEARKFFIDAEGKFYGKSKAAKVSASKPAPARPATEVTTQIPEGVANPQAGASAPAPAPAATTPAKTPAKAPAKSTASKKPAQTPTKDPAAEAADVLEQQNKQAQAAATVVPAAPPAATTTKAPAATKAPAKAPVATKSQTQDPVAPVSKRLQNSLNATLNSPRARARRQRGKGANAAAPAKATKAEPAKTTPAKAAPVAKAAPAEAPHIVYNGQKVFTDPDFIKKWGDKGVDMSIEAQKKEIDARAKGFSRVGPFRYFDQFQTDEGGIPFTGKVAKDRFIKKLRDEDLDRRDANLLRAGGAGALAGLLLKAPLSAGKRALIGAGAGGLGVLATRMATNNTRDIYGERSRGAKRAELAPAIAGLGAAGYFASRRLRGLAARFNGRVKEFGSMGLGRQARIHADALQRHRKKMRGFSARLRGVKNFDDYRLYYFKGRNTGIAARSAEEARKKKKRGGDELVAVRTPSDSERSQMARGVWVRTRRDGKSPGQSRYGKGRGQGPARKSMGARLAQMKFFAEKQDGKKRELNPYVGAALSGGASGAVLGGLSILKRGTGALAALKNAGKLGGVSAGIVGGGALLGSRIVGKPREDESAPFTKRAGIGGAIAGAGVGLAGALALRKTKGGAKVLEKAAKNWRPAMWVRESPLAVAGGVGAVGGALYGGAQGLDEGQQVDSIRNLKKDMRTIASDQGERAWKSAARTSVHGFSRKEFQVSPLPDVEPFEATYGRRSGERNKFVRNAAILGAVGLVGVGGYRFGKAAKAAAGAAKATKSAKAGPRNSQSWKHEAGPDFWEEARRAAYGETGGRSQSGGRSYGSYDSDYAKRSAEAKSNWQREQAKRSSSSSSSSSGTRARGRGEDANPYAGTPKADAWEKWRAMDRMSKESQMPGERESAEKMKAIWKKRHNLARKLHGLKLFGRDDQPRYRGSKAWADPIHGWVTGADLVDKDGNPWKPSSPQLVNAMVNRAKRERIKVQRGYGLTKDVSAVMQGKDRERDASGRIKKREWEKSWFKNMVTTGALAAAGLVGAGAWRYGRMNPGTGIGRVVRKTEAGVENLKKKADKGMGDFMRGVDDMTGSRFATGRKLFAAKFRRLREFDAIAAEAGWDARDPRGRSVRVFAPGSRRRERREKAWHEKTENERTLWKAGIAAGVLAGGLGGVGIYRLAKGKPLIPRFGKPAAGVGGDGGIAEGPPEWFTRVRSAFKK
jgi:hypothetical protein